MFQKLGYVFSPDPEFVHGFGCYWGYGPLDPCRVLNWLYTSFHQPRKSYYPTDIDFCLVRTLLDEHTQTGRGGRKRGGREI